MLLSILSGIVRGWFWDLWCDWWALRSLVTFHFPGSTPDFIDYVRESWAYQHYYAGESVCDRGISSWRHWAKDAFKKWLDERLDDARDAAVDLAKAITGPVRHSFSTLSNWIEVIWSRVDPLVDIFADSLSAAVNRLKEWIPSAIRTGRGWLDWIDGNLVQPAKNALEGLIATVRSIANDAWDWVISAGDTLKRWYNSAHDWLDDLRHNFKARVKAVFGAVWDWLVGFYNDPVGTIVGIWGISRADVHNFFDHPLLWLIDRFKDPLARGERWLARELWDIVDLAIDLLKEI